MARRMTIKVTCKGCGIKVKAKNSHTCPKCRKEFCEDCGSLDFRAFWICNGCETNRSPMKKEMKSSALKFGGKIKEIPHIV